MRGDADIALACWRFGVKMRRRVGSDSNGQHRQNRHEGDQGFADAAAVTRFDQGFFFC